MSGATVLSVEVDGVRVSPGNVIVIFQRDPFPGGHTYTIRLDRAAAERRFGGLWPAGGGAPAEEVQRKLMWRLESLLVGPRTEGGVFVLNNVTTVMVGETDVVVGGVCSDVVA
ncbi:unnamed protein product [[Actinomadura] parvosata subsp. kistnae]|uniref:Uncharacterized protein n=1 Tax=[Actinomadura] parvosata subsp. kistnae TaxID=1909395 RepID=A0A1V0A0N7_9ACTN|nr:hypothetical protein [Nonomuraea sp. ATCC 55076]AQZ63739.1 hypothetical protein BKM31_21765 [Nonomuraea sp. ATCC 55076]SPL89541.1 unnamed protein product [Actinomadura parvosata subsp. kistnae]